MKRILIYTVLVVCVILIAAAFIYQQLTRNVVETEAPVSVPQREPAQDNEEQETQSELPAMTVIAENLTIPWDVIFLSDTELLVSERDGTIARIDTATGAVTEIDVPDVSHRGEGGLLGMVAHPEFAENRQLFLYRTSTLSEGSNASVNEVVRYTLSGIELTEPEIILGDIPGSLYHNGGRIAFGPDGYLYVATGDARDPEAAQDTNSLAGKILRVAANGAVPAGNPFGNEVYSYGHRNPQGLAWDEQGNLWSTEHGRTTATLTGMDELNRIAAGANYGWPDSEGDTIEAGTIGPVIHSGADTTWAPGGATYYDGSIFYGGLRGERLYEAVLNEARTDVTELREHFVGEYGRIRTTLIGPDGGLYFTTSNRDGRGAVTDNDDRIIRVNPRTVREE